MKNNNNYLLFLLGGTVLFLGGYNMDKYNGIFLKQNNNRIWEELFNGISNIQDKIIIHWRNKWNKNKTKIDIKTKKIR